MTAFEFHSDSISSQALQDRQKLCTYHNFYLQDSLDEQIVLESWDIESDRRIRLFWERIIVFVSYFVARDPNHIAWW